MHQKIKSDRLKRLGIVCVFIAPEHPITTLILLKGQPGEQHGVVSQYVQTELELHYSIPKALDKMTHCLRPDLLAMVYKAWKHTPDPRALESVIQASCAEQWELNPYALVTRHVASALAWCGAAVIETGQKHGADMVVGNAYYNICYKDKAITILAILCGIQHNKLARAVFEAGPPLFKSLCSEAPRVFCAGGSPTN